MSSSSRKDTVNRRSGYTSLNPQTYKGGRPDGNKSYGKAHGLQSLGKFATSRRMPTPASLPSLRSENAGNDPSVNLVPSGGGGWKSSKEEKESKVENEVHRRDKPIPSPARKFKAEFPSLEEQEGMSKKELEELERRQREEQERMEGERERSPERNGSRPPGEKGWRDPPPVPPPGPHAPPGPPHMGPYPPPRGPFPPHHPYPPYMMPPPRPGMPPYPMPGPGGRYPPPHAMHFRPPFPNYPHLSNPYEMDPYKYPSRKGERGKEISRPPTVKANDLKNMEVGEDEEVGWAGHHEEVDYSKEVIFEDSSDEEASGRIDDEKPEKKERKLAKFGKNTSDERDQKRRRNDEGRGDTEMDAEAPRDRDEEQERDREGEKDREQVWEGRRQEGGRGERGERTSESNPPRQVPPYPPYHTYSYPPPYDPYRYPHVYPPSHGHYPIPPSYPPPSQRYGPQRGGKRGPPDRDEPFGRHDFHPSWSHDINYRLKRRFSEEERVDEKERERERERPRILSKSNERRNSLKDNEHRDDTATKENDQGRDSAPERHGSASPATHEAPTKPHVTFADEGRENSQSPLDDQSTQVTAPMRQHKKIIMRKMGERESESPSEKQDQGGSRGQRERPKDLKTGEPGAERDSPDSRTPDRDLKVRQAWNVNDRGPIMSPMTLYEPEGKKSEAKFLKYQHQSGKVGREKHRTNSTGSKGDQEERELCSPTESKSPGEEPPEQEEQPRNEEEIADKRAQTTSPSSEKERRSGDRRGEHRKGPSERPRRQDSGRFHERHESRDAKDRPKHRREDPVRERPRRHDSSSTAGEHYEVGERGRPELSGRGSDWQEPARERGGYKSHESGRQQADRERDRDRDKERGGYSKQEPSARGYERRDGERGDRRRRDYPDTRPPPHRREQDQGERTGRQERRQPKPETVRHREEKHPREKQERVRSEEQWEPQAEHTPSPIEKTPTVKTPTVEGGKDVAFSSERPRPIQHGESSSEQGSGEMKTLGETNDPKEQRMERRRPRDGRRDDGRRSERPSDRPRGQRGGQGERERDRGGKYLPRDRERGERERDERDRGDGERGERGRGDREKERGPRPHGGRQSSRDSFRSEQHEREGDERRQGRDARRTDYPERRDRGEQLGGRTRERPTPQGRRPPRSSERAEAVSEKPSSVETGRKQPEWRKEKGGKPSLTGYSGLEDISGSDWEQEIEEDSRKKQEESDLGQAAESKREQKPERRHPPRSEKPHRGDDKRHSREERRDQPQEPPPRRGRGRGRSEEARRERRGPDSARPSSYSSQRRQTGTGTGESSSKTDSKHSDTQRESREHSAMASLSHDSLDSIKLEKKAESHKSDFERYDLNSHKVAIVDDIGGQNVDEESLSPFAQSEFVEVTSKKAQKEKLKREKEEQRKLDEEKRRQKEEQLKRAKKTAGARSQGSYDRAGHLHPSHKPLTAWGSTNEGSSIWGSPSASDVSSRPEDWQSSLLPSSSAAPGSHLKVSESLWSNPSSPNVGVIGDSLQTKLNVGATGTSTFLAPSASSGDAAYSLFGHNPLSSPLLTTPPLVPHAGTTGTSGSMLDAAVDSTVPKVSQDALGSGVSSENPLASDVTQTTESHPTLPATSESETKDREEKEEGREFQKIEPRSRGRGKNLPPRFQSSKSQQQPSGPGRGRGIVRGAERKVGSGGKSEKAPADRFYVPPKAREETTKSQKPTSSKQQSGSSKPAAKPQPQPSSGTGKQPKVAGNECGGLVTSPSGVASCESSCDPSPDPLAGESSTNRQQQPTRAGSSPAALEDQVAIKTGASKTELGLQSSHSGSRGLALCDTDSREVASKSGCGGHLHAGQSSRQGSSNSKIPGSRESRPSSSKSDGSGYVQRNKPSQTTSTKTFSYADALKTALHPPQPSSKVSSRSQSPSECSLTQVSTSRSRASSGASTPALSSSSRPSGTPVPGSESAKLAQESEKGEQGGRASEDNSGEESSENLLSGRASAEPHPPDGTKIAPSSAKSEPDGGPLVAQNKPVCSPVCSNGAEPLVTLPVASWDSSKQNTAAKEPEKEQELLPPPIAKPELSVTDKHTSDVPKPEVKPVPAVPVAITSSEEPVNTIPVVQNERGNTPSQPSVPKSSPPGLSLNRAHPGQLASVFPQAVPSTPPLSPSLLSQPQAIPPSITPSHSHEREKLSTADDPHPPMTTATVTQPPSQGYTAPHGSQLQQSVPVIPNKVLFNRLAPVPVPASQSNPIMLLNQQQSRAVAMAAIQQQMAQQQLVRQQKHQAVAAAHQHLLVQQQLARQHALQQHQHAQLGRRVQNQPEKFGNVSPPHMLIRPMPIATSRGSPIALPQALSVGAHGARMTLRAENQMQPLASAFMPYAKGPPVTQPYSGAGTGTEEPPHFNLPIASTEQPVSQGLAVSKASPPEHRVIETANSMTAEKENQDDNSEAKSRLSIAAVPFVPSGGTGLTTGVPSQPARKVSSSSVSSSEGSAPTPSHVPILQLPRQQVLHPPGFDPHPSAPPVMDPVVLQQNMRLMRPPSFPTMAAPPLAGHPPMVAGSSLQPVPVIPQQSLQERKTSLQQMYFNQSHYPHMHTSEPPTSAVQVITPPTVEYTAKFPRRQTSQEGPNQRKPPGIHPWDNPGVRMPAHLGANEQAVLVAGMQARGLLLPNTATYNPRMAPTPLELQRYGSGKHIPLAKAPPSNKKALLPTPPVTPVIPPGAALLSSGQAWPVRLPHTHAPGVQMPFSQDQQRLNSLFTGHTGQFLS